MTRKVSLVLLALALPATAFAQDTLDPGVAGDLTLTLTVDGLGGPTSLDFLPDGRMLITQQNGSFRLWDGTNGVNTVAAGSLNNVQAGGERGLLHVAVDPMFATTNRIYVYYSTGGAQAVGYTTFDTGTGQVDPDVTNLVEGLAANRNHDGGALEFGTDGLIYIGVGDTGCNCNCAPGTNTDNYFPTCLNKYHGKILRIDRDGNIPASNPLVGVNDVAACNTGNACNAADDEPAGTAAPLTEIYNWGFRNPWRLTMDEQTGYLWIGDVGEITFEEITISQGPGEHHGWPYREGMQGLNATTCQTIVPQSVGPCVDPAIAYPHSETPAAGQGSITGGVFSNHCSWPAAYHGLYWFGDYNKTRIWALTPNANRDGIVGGRTLVGTSINGVVDFDRGPDGALYYTTINDGQIYRIAPANPVPCDMDGGVPDADVDAGPEDTGTGTVADAGPNDTGGPAPDTGNPPVDTGVGNPPVDTGVGNPPVDSGVVDSGSTTTVGGGCGGCSSAGAGTAGLAQLGLLLGLLCWLRRRR